MDFRGGETLFLDQEDKANERGKATPVVPLTGRVVVFEHTLWHSGSPLRPMPPMASGPAAADAMFGTADATEAVPEGQKICVRTDLFFESAMPAFSAEQDG